MAYLEGRTYFDADSHVMEVPGWLEGYADPGIRARLKPLSTGLDATLAAGIREAALVDSRPRAAEAEAGFMSLKGWDGIGATDSAARSRALDLLGVAGQLVFPTFAVTQFMGDDLDLYYGGARALNRAMAAFCADDKRMVAVGTVPLEDPMSAVACAREAIREGCGAIWVPTKPPAERSPFHPDLDAFWETLVEADVPFVVHIGLGGKMLRDSFRNNGRPEPRDWLGGGENLRSKDFAVVQHSPEAFLSCMVLDGHLERFPTLRGGCIELGAMWVVPLLERLDRAQDLFSRSEPDLAALPLRASEYVRRQLKFTPFAHEPLGWMVEQAGADLFMFSTDYPHPEGGRDPVAKFEAALGEVDESVRARFYASNYAKLMAIESVVGTGR